MLWTMKGVRHLARSSSPRASWSIYTDWSSHHRLSGLWLSASFATKTWRLAILMSTRISAPKSLLSQLKNNYKEYLRYKLMRAHHHGWTRTPPLMTSLMGLSQMSTRQRLRKIYKSLFSPPIIDRASNIILLSLRRWVPRPQTRGSRDTQARLDYGTAYPTRDM